MMRQVSLLDLVWSWTVSTAELARMQAILEDHPSRRKDDLFSGFGGQCHVKGYVRPFRFGNKEFLNIHTGGIDVFVLRLELKTFLDQTTPQKQRQYGLQLRASCVLTLWSSQDPLP